MKLGEFLNVALPNESAQYNQFTRERIEFNITSKDEGLELKVRGDSDFLKTDLFKNIEIIQIRAVGIDKYALKIKGIYENEGSEDLSTK